MYSWFLKSNTFSIITLSDVYTPTYVFLLVNSTNINLHHILHRFQVVADYWSNFCCRHGVPLLNIFVRGESLNSGL